MSSLELGFALGVSVIGLDETSAVEYAFAAQGTQTAILRRRMMILPPPAPQGRQHGGFGGGGFGGGNMVDQQFAYVMQLVRKPVKPAEEWQVRLWYPAEGHPNNDELMDELSNCVEVQIEELTERLR
jgi:hypothetical protein